MQVTCHVLGHARVGLLLLKCMAALLWHDKACSQSSREKRMQV